MNHTEKAIGDRILSGKDLSQDSAVFHHEQLAPEIARGASVEFEAAMAAAGLQVPLGGVKADGQIRRCDVVGKDGEGEGSHQLQLDGIPAGWFQYNRDSARPRRWHARTEQKRTPAEIAALIQASHFSTEGGYAMSDDNIVQLIQPGSFSDPLTEVLRNGARSLLAKAVEAEVASFLAKHADLKNR